ncbi:LytR/AlgR family response regulator transcription factor [Polaribacter sp. Asnod1-A03]|uniref:LytR/AlgR family response regulator transcription factor n=1 Tax=Polaribacter sp. Asnod1-A03 TaxID=3160581 RepID=UPI00386CF7EB
MVNSIKIYIVEDMAFSRASLESMLILNDYKISGSTAKAEIAWDELKNSKTDLVLIDINLAGEKNGIWLAEQIRNYLNLPIVFLTAYGDEKTVENVLDTKPNGYLMKPYKLVTLLATIKIALNNFSENQKATVLSENQKVLNDFVFIKDKYMRIKLQISDILFIKSEGNYLEINLENKKHVIRSKLSEFKKLLPTKIFFQTHQRYVINLTKIKAVGKKKLTIHNDEIPISSKYKESVSKLFTIK